MTTRPGSPRRWETMSFVEFLRADGVPPEIIDSAVNGVRTRAPIEPAVVDRMDAEFRVFMEDDLSLPTIARMITSQGYETINHMNRYINTIVNGRLTDIYVMTADAPSPAGRRRTIHIGGYDTSISGCVDHYPLFTLGVLSAVDPMFNGQTEIYSER